MESVTEVLIVSDSGSKDSNCSMYDIQSGGHIETYKDGHSVRNGLDCIGVDYLISAFKEKPYMKVWQFGQASNVCSRMTTPGIVSALAVSKCGRYCIAGIGKGTYIWEVASGNLETHLKYHIQDITCVRFSNDGSHFITGGKDGMVFVFLLTEAIRPQDSPADVPKAHFTWMDHIAEVTDVYVGYMSFYSRVATASKDMTCRIYELDTGYHLCTIHLEVALTSVAMDICEYFLFLGSIDGDIYKINLFSMSEAEMHFEDTEKKSAFVGHRKEISSLCVSQSGKYLISGSADKECRIWDITNFSCFRTLSFPGSVTNVMTALIPPGIKNKKYLPRLVVNDFKRSCSSGDDETETNIASEELSLFHAGTPDQFFDSRVLNCTTEKLGKILARGNVTFDDLSHINNEIFSFALNDVFNKADTNNPESDNSN